MAMPRVRFTIRRLLVMIVAAALLLPASSVSGPGSDARRGFSDSNPRSL